MKAFFLEYFYEVYFIYGLSFIIMGIAITLQVKEYTNKTFSNNLWLLAVFGYLHGLSEWTYFYLPYRESDFTSSSLFILEVIDLNLVGISFGFLLFFALQFLYDIHKHALVKYLFYISIGSLISWLVYFVFYQLIFIGDNPDYWFNLAEIISRYFFALPAGLIACYAVYQHKKQLQTTNKYTGYVYNLLMIAFMGYGIFAGFLVPSADFFPADVINTETFFKLTKLPVPLFRTFFSILITLSILLILRKFQLENISLIGRTVSENAILQERERIKKDLHDDIMQSIYSVGLALESCKYELDSGDTEEVRERLDKSAKQLDNILSDMRLYIQDLKSAELASLTISEIISRIVQRFKRHLNIEFKNDLKSFIDVKPEIKAAIHNTLGELLINAVKHSQADKITITIKAGQANNILITLEDNGVGVDLKELQRKQSQREKLGLVHVKERIHTLGGEFNFQTEKSKGTKFYLELPKKGG
ncbi:sensor histidine kinase [Natranaerobius thermophilus]|uniref:Oxygen sensor histidine kinase NreB n=1 Tax=Natranaerobius thermophilus (strain ATCC BAA-1301 / DSM 18059 / JW/NM-WN-LF) TaxID=457570 RepID=B2A791_NATTJ|nr:ATP-binding protein [Natranaerobius thermophilus]ACB84285.1 integral membrane sensor signal transduction histidine kinase [Natranaerobius thermophilus JW/NM-WN-LF]